MDILFVQELDILGPSLWGFWNSVGQTLQTLVFLLGVISFQQVLHHLLIIYLTNLLRLILNL